MSTRRNFPPNGTAGFARLAVRGYNRWPRPPPSMIATIFAMYLPLKKCILHGACGQGRLRGSPVSPFMEIESMGQFIAAQRDYLSFISLCAYFLAAVECVVLNREERGRRWLSFMGFFLFQSLAVFWILVSIVASTGEWGAFITSFLLSLSFGSLFTLHTGPANRQRALAIAALSTGLVVCAGTGLVFGAAPCSSVSRLLLGIPGTALAVRFLLSDPSIRGRQRPWLVAHAWTFALFGLLMLVGLIAEALLHGGYETAALVPRVFVSLVLAVTLSMHEWRSFARLNRGYGRPLTRLVIYGSFLALPVLLVLGGIVTSRLGQNAMEALRTRYRTETNGILSAVSAQTGEVDRVLSIVTGSPVLAKFLKDRDDVSRAQTQDLLNRVAQAFQAACYLLNRGGSVVAFSRGAPDSFIVPLHAADPWFREAVEGGAGRSFSLDLPTYARGYHTAGPVWDQTEGITGVGVVVKEIESVFPSGGTDQNAFLVNEDGLIFYAIPHELTYRLLWPLAAPPAQGRTTPAQFGLFQARPVLDAKPVDGGFVSWAGSTFVSSRAFLSVPGWSIVHLGPVTQILQFRFEGLLATLMVMLVVAVFSAVGQMSLLDEARVERSESLYRTLIEGTPDWISIVRTDGAFTFTNRAGRESLGLGGSGSSDRSIERVLGPDHVASLARNVQFALQGGVLLFEAVLPSASGDAKVWHLTLVPLQTAGQEPSAILIGNDVTEMRGAEARLVRAERMAALGTLAAGVAHQFNNINAVAMGYLQVLQAEPGLSDKARKYLGSIRHALERSVLITSRLLPLSTPQVEHEPVCPVEDAVRSALSLVQADLDRERVTLGLKLEPGVAASITAEQLSFIVEALLVNAWHATLGQEVRHIQVSTGTMEKEVFIRVEDTGIGIAREKLSSLFTPFFTEKGEHAAPRSAQAGVRGVGLSLAVVNSMVGARAGRVEIQSEPGSGSCFTVWLPGG